MARSPERRSDPSIVLPGARSVISVGMNYYSPEQHSQLPGHAKISRYAWGDDYHAILEERLEKLEGFIGSLGPDVETRRYVDTGPVMDKAWAARAGLGWIGKHTNVLTRTHGSWIFIGTVLTSLECATDEPATDMCGTCTACVDACPTDAFPEPYVLDAARCISYLTIEHRGSLPEEHAGHLNGWIFGCDICQDVCPWNRFQQQTPEKAFSPRPGLVDPDLGTLSALTPEEFSVTFRGSPVKRAKHDGFHRNIRSVLESSR